MNRHIWIIQLEVTTKMMKYLKCILATLVLSCVAQPAFAQSFFCGGSGAGAYCQYQGKVARAYINEDNAILLYFEQPVDVTQIANVGITGVSNGSAGIFITSGNQNYAEFLYSTMLTALAADKTVIVQFRQGQSGYLKIGKIWIYK